MIIGGVKMRDFSIFVAKIEITQTVSLYDTCQEYVGSSKVQKMLTIRTLANSSCEHLVRAHLENSFKDCDLFIESITQEKIHKTIMVS